MVLLSSCQSTPKAKPDLQNQSSTVVAHGYALLFDLMGDESNVSKLLIIKREHKVLQGLVKEISKTCGEAHKRLKDFGKMDRALNLKDQGLPPAEVAARKAIGKTKAKALLTDHGKDFEIQLLLSQSEALTYGSHLALITAEADGNPQQAQFLRELSQELTRLQANVVAMISAHYSWQ